MPHPKTLKKWYKRSDLNCSPGILKEAQNILKKECEKEGKAYVAVSFDEMNIKKFLKWNNWKKEFDGFITYPVEKYDKHPPLASNVLVFMVTIIGCNMSIPFAYFPISSLKEKEKKKLLTRVLRALNEVKATVISICCDGHSTNIPMFTSMGACFKSDAMKPFMRNPVNGETICVLLDACHMTKLIRNALCDFKSIFHPDHGKIKWDYIERLVETKYVHGFLAHKLTKKHFEFKLNARNKMNVRIAVETFSNSTSKSMHFLQQNGVKGFMNSTPTYLFIDHMDKIFDVFNSKKLVNDSLKSVNHRKFFKI